MLARVTPMTLVATEKYIELLHSLGIDWPWAQYLVAALAL